MSDVDRTGRRERKKAATRASIVQAAQTLFLERGFDAVSVREIADKADVSPTTVFAHFPQKESLAFGDEYERHEQLVAVVSRRAPGSSISDALKQHYLAEIAAFQSGPQAQMLALMEQTPALVDYAERMWFRHEDALVAAITEESVLERPSDEIRFYVRAALYIQLLAIKEDDPAATIDAGFRVLDRGWVDYEDDLTAPAPQAPRAIRGSARS
jgi:AcrR family transcriptional regulator